MPSSVRRYSGRCVTSWPNSRTWPDDGRCVPVTQWNSVVLPAPLGPISARRSPGATRSVTPSTARSPPNTFARFSTSTAALMGLHLWRLTLRLRDAHAQAVDEPDDAVGRPQDRRDEDDAHDRGVKLEEAAHPVAQAEHDAGAEKRPDDGAGAADDRHERNLDRNLERGGDRIDEAIVVDVEHACEARHRARDHERRIEVLGRAVAEAAHAAFARLDAAQRQPERRR